MYEISVEQSFDAAHFLRGYQGRCEALHGHSFKVVVKVSASALNQIGMAYDFTELRQHLSTILARLDHTCLNDVPPFNKINPSSENLATTIYQELHSILAKAPVSLTGVEVWESPHSRAAYRPD